MPVRDQCIMLDKQFLLATRSQDYENNSKSQQGPRRQQGPSSAGLRDPPQRDLAVEVNQVVVASGCNIVRIDSVQPQYMGGKDGLGP